ncbi:TraR/DksA C4-type zinc finger protein [Pseudomonas sp. NFACC45]
MPIPEGRRLALVGVQFCAECQARRDRARGR